MLEITRQGKENSDRIERLEVNQQGRKIAECKGAVSSLDRMNHLKDRNSKMKRKLHCIRNVKFTEI